jgi:uncharacterized protein YodC (DUF2158 family)
VSLGLRKDYEQFEVGALVTLKGGSPTMTVVRGTNHEGDVEVSWFHQAGIQADGTAVYGECSATRYPAAALLRVTKTV